MITSLLSTCRRVALAALLAGTAPLAIAGPLFSGPTNGTGGFAPGLYEITIAGQPAKVIVGAGYNPATPTYLAYYLHGDEGGYDWQTAVGNPVRTFIDQNNLVFIAPRAPKRADGGNSWPWDASGGGSRAANAAQIQEALDYMFAHYNVHRDKVLGAGVSGGSWFHDAWFFPKLGADYPSYFNLGCGASGMDANAPGYPDALALSQKPVPVAASQLKYTIGTTDFLYPFATTSVPTYTALGFSVRTEFFEGIGHCLFDVPGEIAEYWTESLQVFKSTVAPVVSLNPRLARVPATANINITWDSTPGRSYVIQVSDQLTPAASWQTLTTVPAAASPATATTHTDTGTLQVAGRTRRFYKVAVAP